MTSNNNSNDLNIMILLILVFVHLLFTHLVQKFVVATGDSGGRKGGNLIQMMSEGYVPIVLLVIK